MIMSQIMAQILMIQSPKFALVTTKNITALAIIYLEICQDCFTVPVQTDWDKILIETRCSLQLRLPICNGQESLISASALSSMTLYQKLQADFCCTCIFFVNEICLTYLA